MKFRFYNRVILIALLILCSFSCSSDLDYDQVNDFNVEPVFTTNLAYLEKKAPDFVDNGIEDSFFPYFTNVEFLNKSFVQEDLIKAEMYFRVKNTINRAYTFNITLLDAGGVLTKNIKIDVAASVNGSEVLEEQTEVFTASNLADLKKTTHMVFTVIMQPGPPLTESSPGRVELSSSITAYFDVE